MASGAVRELITKVKIVIDQASMSQANNAINQLKQRLNTLSGTPAKVKVTADINSINQLKQNMSTLTNKRVSVDANVGGAIGKVNQLKQTINTLQNKSINLSVNASGTTNAINQIKQNISALQNKQLNITANTSNAISKVNQLKQTINTLQNKSINLTVNTNGNNAIGKVNQLKQTINTLTNKRVSVDANVGGAIGKVNQLKQRINELQNKSINLTVNTNGNNAIGAINRLHQSLSQINNRQIDLRVRAQSVNQAVNSVRRLNQMLSQIRSSVSMNIRINTQSLTNAQRAIDRIKNDLNRLNGRNVKLRVNVDSSSLNSALAHIRNQMANLNLQVHANASVMSIKAATVNLYGRINNRGGGGGGGGNGGGRGGGRGGNGGGQGNALADNAGTLAATGAAMVAPLALPVSTAMDFEAAMSKVKAITNSTDEDMARLTATARELGANTQYSATEAAQAMSYLGMAGWKTEQIIAGMPGLLDLAAASGEDLARVADIVSDDLTAFHMSADQAAHMADVMAAASTNANTNVSMMGETFKYAGAIAGSLGYSLEDVAAAAGLMANAGIKSEMAGTALRSIMTRMIKPPKEAAAALDQLGVSATNADGTVKPFREQLIALRNAMKGLTDAQKAEMANSIAGQEAMTGFLNVVNASDDDFAKMTNAVDNSDGAAKKMADTMNANTKGAIKGLKGALEGLSITIGNTFLGALTGVIKGVTDFARALGEFAQEHPKLVGGIAAAIAVIGGLLVVLGGIGLAIGGIMTAFSALAPIFSAIGGAITAVLSVGLGPLLAILAAIASVIYFVGENWETVVSWFQPGIDSIMEGIKQLQQAWQNLQPFIKAITPLLQAIATVIGVVIVGAVSLLWRIFAAAFNAIAGLINWVAGLLGDLGETIQWIAGGLAGLIDKAAQFIGMKGQIDGVNSSITQKWADRAMGGNTNTQNINVGSINVPTASDVGAGIGSLATTPTYFDYQ